MRFGECVLTTVKCVSGLIRFGKCIFYYRKACRTLVEVRSGRFHHACRGLESAF